MHQHEHCRARYPCLYWATSSSDGLGARFCSFTFQQQHQLISQCWHSYQAAASTVLVTYIQASTACDSVNFLINSVFLAKIGVSAKQLTFSPRYNIEEDGSNLDVWNGSQPKLSLCKRLRWEKLLLQADEHEQVKRAAGGLWPDQLDANPWIIVSGPSDLITDTPRLTTMRITWINVTR